MEGERDLRRDCFAPGAVRCPKLTPLSQGLHLEMCPWAGGGNFLGWGVWAWLSPVRSEVGDGPLRVKWPARLGDLFRVTQGDRDWAWSHLY